MSAIGEHRRDEALLNAGRLGGLATDLDLEALEYALAINPGPQFYKDLLAATISFSKEIRRIMHERGHERLKVEIVQVDTSGKPN